jgi:cell division protein YceG involved in septum cleavage
MADGLEWERREREAREAHERRKAAIVVANYLKEDLRLPNEVSIAFHKLLELSNVSTDIFPVSNYTPYVKK